MNLVSFRERDNAWDRVSNSFAFKDDIVALADEHLEEEAKMSKRSLP
jgi:hypothetical protein